jgi:hypothetical protein
LPAAALLELLPALLLAAVLLELLLLELLLLELLEQAARAIGMTAATARPATRTECLRAIQSS